MTGEDQILKVLTDVHLSVGRLEGTVNAILEDQVAQNQQLAGIRRRLQAVESQQSIDEYDQRVATDATAKRARRRGNFVQGVWLTLAAIIGASAGAVLHAIGIA